MLEWKDEDFGRSAPFLFCLNMKKILSLILLCVFSFATIHAEITWTLSENGTLTISGTDMQGYYGYTYYAPWYSQRDKIKKVVIENGVTNISNRAFLECY